MSFNSKLAAMEPMDQERMEHAEKILAKGRAALPSDLTNGLYWIKSALSLRASTLLRNDDSRALQSINELVETVAQLWQENKRQITVYEQNDLVFLALFARNRTGAIKIASLPVEESDVHPYALTVRAALATALGVPSSPAPQYKPSTSEQGFFEDLQAVAVGTSTNLLGTDRFWTALRKKRFANTIFEFKNIFRGALEFLHGT